MLQSSKLNLIKSIYNSKLFLILKQIGICFILCITSYFTHPTNKKIKMTKQSLTTPPVFVVSSPRVFCQGQIEESKACRESPPGKTSIQADY